MATFTERIRLIFDVDSKGAKTGFDQFGNDVRKTEGLFGRAKAGVGSLVDQIKQNMGTALIAGGAAHVGLSGDGLRCVVERALFFACAQAKDLVQRLTRSSCPSIGLERRRGA